MKKTLGLLLFLAASWASGQALTPFYLTLQPVGGGTAPGGGGSGSVATDTLWDAAGDLAVGTGADTAARLAKGTPYQRLGVNAAGTVGWIDPYSTIIISDDFLCGGPTAAATVINSCIGTIAVNTSGTATTVGEVAANENGIAQLSTSTSATGISAFGPSDASSTILVNNMRSVWRVRVPTLSTTAETFTVIAGSLDANLTTNSFGSDGVYFTYTDVSPSTTPNWMIVVQDGGATAGVDTGVAVVAGSWYKLSWWYESGVGVHFYINDAETTNSPINTNLPLTVNSEEFRPYTAKIFKTGPGTTARTFDIDYMSVMFPVTR